MLRYKGIEFTRLDLPNMSHKAMLPLLRYRGSTVPVMTLDGKRVSGTMKIARALEHFIPTRRCSPRDDQGAEAWADSVLQDGVRQLGRYAAAKDREAMASFVDGAGARRSRRVTCAGAMPAIRPVVALQMRISDETARRAWRRSRASSTASTRCWPKA